MKNSIKALVGLDLTFVILLAVSGMLEGIVSEAVYYLAFIIPIGVGLYLLRKDDGGAFLPFKIKGRDFALSLPVYMPAIFVILCLSYLTSLLLGLLGASAPIVEDASLPMMLVIHALLPAVLEELLFRYLPMRFMQEGSFVTVGLVSALLFSFVHCSLFQIPYAFVAGFIFMLLDLAARSVYPSILLHLLNNALSVISIKYCNTHTASLVFFLSVGALAVISCIFIYAYRKSYSEKLAELKKKGERFDYSHLSLLMIPTLAVAIYNLF